MFVCIGILTLPGIVAFAILYLLLVPCDIGNLGYTYFPSCNPDTVNSYDFVGTVLRFVSPCILAWIALHAFARCIAEYTIFSSMHCYCLINYLYLFQHNVINNKDKPIAVKMFKEIQILTLVYNGIHQGSLTFAGTSLCVYVFILSVYAIISLSQYLIFPQFLFFGALAFDAVFIIVIVDGAFKAGVYRVSKKVLDSVQNAVTSTQVRNLGLKLSRKYVRSWRVSKVFMGDVNFYDEKTALILLHFNISQVVNLLLM